MTSGGISTLQSHNMELSGTSTVLKQNTWNTHRGHMMREHITAGALWDTSCYVISIEVRGDVDGSSEVGGASLAQAGKELGPTSCFHWSEDRK